MLLLSLAQIIAFINVELIDKPLLTKHVKKLLIHLDELNIRNYTSLQCNSGKFCRILTDSNNSLMQ